MDNEENELRRWCIAQIVPRGYSSIENLLSEARMIEDYINYGTREKK